MTFKELIETTHNLGEIDVQVRDTRLKLLREIHIGSRVDEDRVGSHDTQPRWECVKMPINLKESGGDYWGTLLKNIPTDLLKLEVHWWDIRGKAFDLNNGQWEFKRLTVWLLGVDKFIETTATETEELEGQMCIEDFLK